MIERLLNPIKARIRLMVGKCLVTACGGGKVDLSLLAGESREDVEFYQQYGFSSRPVGTVRGVAVFVGGSRDNGALIACRGEDDDMKVGLEPGEVAVHSKFGSSIFLKKDGSIVAKPASGKPYLIDGDLEATGEVSAKVNSAKVTLTCHIHPTGVGPTSQPTPGQ